MDPSERLLGGESEKIMRRLNRMIRSTQRGETIRIAVLGIGVSNDSATVQALIDAYKRRVAVKIVLPATQQDLPAAKALARRFNRPDVHDNSYIEFCEGGCYASDGFGLLHVKMFLSSKVGRAKNLALITSKNFRMAQGESSAFNDGYTSVNEPEIYHALRQHFDGMRHDTEAPIRPPVHSNGKVYHFFPNPQVTIHDDLYTEALTQVECHGAAEGYGNAEGRTKVLISNPIWPRNRRDVANRVSGLKADGCVVKVMTSRERASRGVMRRLTDGNVPVRFTDQYREDGVRRLFSHSKNMLISGTMGTVNEMAKVFMGTAAISLPAMQYNDNVMVEIVNDLSTYQAYEAYFTKVWRQSTDIHEADFARMTPAGGGEGVDQD